MSSSGLLTLSGSEPRHLAFSGGEHPLVDAWRNLNRVSWDNDQGRRQLSRNHPAFGDISNSPVPLYLSCQMWIVGQNQTDSPQSEITNLQREDYRLFTGIHFDVIYWLPGVTIFVSLGRRRTPCSSWSLWTFSLDPFSHGTSHEASTVCLRATWQGSQLWALRHSWEGRWGYVIPRCHRGDRHPWGCAPWLPAPERVSPSHGRCVEHGLSLPASAARESLIVLQIPISTCRLWNYLWAYMIPHLVCFIGKKTEAQRRYKVFLAQAMKQSMEKVLMAPEVTMWLWVSCWIYPDFISLQKTHQSFFANL